MSYSFRTCQFLWSTLLGHLLQASHGISTGGEKGGIRLRLGDRWRKRSTMNYNATPYMRAKILEQVFESKLLTYPWKDFTGEAVSHLALQGRGKARCMKERFTHFPPLALHDLLQSRQGSCCVSTSQEEPGAEHVRTCCAGAPGSKEKRSGPQTQALNPNPVLFLPCLLVSLSNVDDHEFSPGGGQVFLIFSAKMSRATQFI